LSSSILLVGNYKDEKALKKTELHQLILTYARNLIHLPPWLILFSFSMHLLRSLFKLILWVRAWLCCLPQVLDTRGHLLTALGYGLWPFMVLLSEIVQTFILADFCYYYVKRWIVKLSEYAIYHILICSRQLSDLFFLLPWLQSCWGTTCSSTSFRSGVT